MGMGARATVFVLLFVACTTACANTPRHPTVRAEFMRLHPCPATGRTRGACPGWQVDHIIPLKCDGPDELSNMQWLTVDEHKQKTAYEAKACGRGNKEVPDNL